MIQELEQHVRECWADLAPGTPPPRRLAFLKCSAGSYPPPEASLLLFVFVEREARPLAVVKAARIPEGDASIRREEEQLRLLRARMPETLSRVMPRLVRSGEINERAFLLTTALPGDTELHHTWTPRQARRSAGRIAAALRWAGDLSRSVPAPEIGMREWLGVESHGAVLKILEAYDWTGEALGEVEPRLAEVWGTRWPAGPAHGDYFPGNVLFSGDEVVGIVDWEMGSLQAPVFVDTLTYEISFAFQSVWRGGSAEHSAAHELPPFASACRTLADAGVDTGRGSAARLAILAAGVLRCAGTWIGRRANSKHYAELLRIECGAGAPRA